jgi:hypothetical protein
VRSVSVGTRGDGREGGRGCSAGAEVETVDRSLPHWWGGKGIGKGQRGGGGFRGAPGQPTRWRREAAVSPGRAPRATATHARSVTVSRVVRRSRVPFVHFSVVGHWWLEGDISWTDYGV